MGAAPRCWHCQADAVNVEERGGFADYTVCLLCARPSAPPVTMPDIALPLPLSLMEWLWCTEYRPGNWRTTRRRAIIVTVLYVVKVGSDGRDQAECIGVEGWPWARKHPQKMVEMATHFRAATGLRLVKYTVILGQMPESCIGRYIGTQEEE